MAGESATPDLVELTRLAFEAANQRDVDGVMSFFAPDAVFAGRALGDLFEGRPAIRGFVDGWFGSFPEGRYELEEFVVLDDGVVLAVVNQEGRPVGVDGQVHQREGWAICWSADGLIVRLAIRADIDEARAAAERLAGERVEAPAGEPMSPDPVDGTHQLHRLLNSRDLDAVTDLFAPGSIWDASRWGLGSHKAPTSLRQFLQDWIGSFDVYEITLEAIEDLGNGIVFAVFFHAADLQGGGGSLRVRSSAVLNWEAGQLVGLTSYRDMDKARVAAERLAEERG